MRPLHAVMREFPPPDIFTAQALRTADPQISCVCAQCARRAAAQVAPDTGPSAHAHSPGSRERLAHTQLAQLLRRCQRLAATGSAQQVTVLRQQGGRRQYAKRLGRGRRRRVCGKNTPTLLFYSFGQLKIVTVQPSAPSVFLPPHTKTFYKLQVSRMALPTAPRFFLPCTPHLTLTPRTLT
jgi:hypothetical protein